MSSLKVRGGEAQCESHPTAPPEHPACTGPARGLLGAALCRFLQTAQPQGTHFTRQPHSSLPQLRDTQAEQLGMSTVSRQPRGLLEAPAEAETRGAPSGACRFPWTPLPSSHPPLPWPLNLSTHPHQGLGARSHPHGEGALRQGTGRQELPGARHCSSH